jgi:hypothetical protein
MVMMTADNDEGDEDMVMVKAGLAAECRDEG